MSRCGCSDACTCALVAGDHTTITGTGDGDNPYVVGADFPVIHSCPSGSTTTDTTVTGTGAEGSPFVICADTEPSAEANNVLSVGTDGKLYVPAGSVGGVNVGCGLTGDGSVGQPLKIKSPAWPFTCTPQAKGQPLGCDLATGLAYGPPAQVLGHADLAALITNLPPGTDADGWYSEVITSFGNPDPCRRCLMFLVTKVDYDLTLTPNTVVKVELNGDRIALIHSADHNASSYGQQYQSVSAPAIVAVGGSSTFTTHLDFTVLAGAASITRTQIGSGTIFAFGMET